MSWEIVVGIETHAQLATRSKMFSAASTTFGAEPNTHASAVDIALPGVLPVPNRTAVEYAVRFGLAVGGSINRRSIFARKNYFYPDLPKGYQISQFELPIVKGGSIAIPAGESAKIVRLTRAHLEEDAGKSLHEDFRDMTGIDLNRAGTPLLEIVSEPDLRGAAESVAYAKTLHGLVRWIEICDGNMQEGSFRCDANVSVRRTGELGLGTRCEIKNLNSFRFLERAIAFEARRQIAVLEDGGTIEQETRLYDPERDETRPMRTKEDAQDYRYFPDPDLLPLVIAEQEIERIRASLPELPDAMRAHFVRDYGLPDYDARTLTANKSLAEYFEAVANAVSDKKAASNWVMGEVLARLNEMGADVYAPRVSPQEVAALINLVTFGTINLSTAKKLFDERWNSPRALEISVHEEVVVRDQISAEIAARGLGQMSDAGALEKLIDEVLAANPKQAADYRAGKEKSFHSLVGQVMKATRGKANPAQVNEILRRKLAP